MWQFSTKDQNCFSRNSVQSHGITPCVKITTGKFPRLNNVACCGSARWASIQVRCSACILVKINSLTYVELGCEIVSNSLKTTVHMGSSAWQQLLSLSEQVFPLCNDDKQLPFRSVVLGNEMRLHRDDDGIHQLILPIFYLPQERWIFLRLATFVSAESVAKAGAQHWKSNVSFLREE